MVTRFKDFDNLEYRRGSIEFGGLVTRLMEYLRMIKKPNSGVLVVSIDKFEEESKIFKSEIKKLITAKESGKPLYDIDIQFEGDNIKFSGFNSMKSKSRVF